MTKKSDHEITRGLPFRRGGSGIGAVASETRDASAVRAPSASASRRVSRVRAPGYDSPMAKRGTPARIEIRKGVMLGKPVVRGTRITVEFLLEKLAVGQTIEAIVKEYPQLERADVLAALDYARSVLGSDLILPRIRSA
jgi:uncharacterized protein (DUF433 family)